MNLQPDLGLIELILIITLVLAVYFDIKEFRIPNKLTLSAVILGLGAALVTNGLPGLYDSLLGGMVGFGLLLIPFLLGGIGGGDVKLLTAVGVLKGITFVLYTAVIMAIIGGIIALYYYILLKQRKMYFPYGIAISLGALITLGIL